ncbi:hypothetical protein [Amphibacillus cookii]|uniref:hypothetical protein n=1 Tax=Amphibacillus cookii TaxID=767787 RepID=UPI001958E198|nr:hypothetical protein [Amphibacillus cookii]MBM7540071.1 prepilin signal peptidase PulO-like enzyme (type II secretory pathway) [Amphibacillus cookii]
MLFHVLLLITFIIVILIYEWKHYQGRDRYVFVMLFALASIYLLAAIVDWRIPEYVQGVDFLLSPLKKPLQAWLDQFQI